jgi:glycine betaine catabolism A
VNYMATRAMPHAGAAADVTSLVERHQPGGPLERAFYTTQEVFEADLRRIFYRRWLFAGHACSIPQPGDFFTWRLGSESIVVVRGKDGEVRAFHNFCRHRGTRICNEEQGHANKLVCPYHRWTYDLDGALITATQREFEVERSELGLLPVPLHNAAGLLFVNFAEDPPDFSDALDALITQMTPHGLEKAKVAHTVDYVVKANWKIIFENNRECYHCPSHHDEYNAATYDVMRDRALFDPALQARLDAITSEANARFRRLGLSEGSSSSDMTGGYYRVHRTPLMEGYVTQSLDGQPIAPLMGDVTELDSGTLRTTFFPNFWQHTNCDHAVAARITPLAADLTQIRGTWLVDAKAVEGRDYTLDTLLPVWDRTNAQDWAICEGQQIGVGSRHYVPGPFSKFRERNVAQFLDWYVGEMRG